VAMVSPTTSRRSKRPIAISKTYHFLYEWYYLTGSNVAVFLPNVK